MTIQEKITTFINEMNYLNNEHVLGAFFYGSYLTGYNTANSDIDMHIIFDNENSEHLIRGNKIVEGTKIEYFEKPINDIYLSIENDYQNQDNALLSIIGKSVIIFDKTGDLEKLQKSTLTRFSTPLPELNVEEAREQVSILDNRMEKLKRYALTDDPYFNHLYHLTIEKIRKFYHKLKGLPKLQTSKVFRVYTDKKYRESFYKERIPEDEFIIMYLYAITIDNLNKIEKYYLVEKIYNFTKKDVKLYNSDDLMDYRISIKSRNSGPVFNLKNLGEKEIEEQSQSRLIKP